MIVRDKPNELQRRAATLASTAQTTLVAERPLLNCLSQL